MSGKDYLKQIKKLETQIKNKGIEEKRAKEIGLDASVIEGEKRKLSQKRSEIIKTIELLPEAEYAVLHKVYEQYKTLYEIAAERDISYRLVNSIHGRALKMVEAIIAEGE